MGSRAANTLIYTEQGGKIAHRKSGSTVTYDSGSTFAINGTFTLGSATGLVVTSAAAKTVIDVQVTPTTPSRVIYIDATFTSGKEAMYVIASSPATTGTTIAGRFRGEGEAASASTANTLGVHGQGIAKDNLYAGTVNAVWGEGIAKDGTTVVTLRGGLFTADSEGTPNSITDMFGAHVRVKTSVTPSSEFYAMRVETEKFGSGVPVDSMIDFKSTTWVGGETIATDVIDLTALVGTVTNIINYSTITATNFLYSNATVTNFLETSADSKGGAGATRGTPNQTATCDGSVVWKIGSKTLLMPLYNAVTIA